MAGKTDLPELNQLLGSWNTDATHPAMPGVVVHGHVDIEWLEGERFLIHRARTDHPDFPDSIAIIGVMGSDRVEGSGGGDVPVKDDETLRMHYFDSRGVFRVYESSLEGGIWRFLREAPGFSQRFTGTFSEDGRTIEGQWELSKDDVTWEKDLQITYRRH